MTASHQSLQFVAVSAMRGGGTGSDTVQANAVL